MEVATQLRDGGGRMRWSRRPLMGWSGSASAPGENEAYGGTKDKEPAMADVPKQSIALVPDTLMQDR